MSHTGNIRGGPRGQDFGAGREERTRIGRAPQGPTGGAGSSFGDEKTSIGRPPPGPSSSSTPSSQTSSQGPNLPSKTPDSPRQNATSDAPKTGIFNFVQDGLETQDEVRPERPRDGKSGVFESPRGSSRSTSERPALRSRGDDARGSAAFENPRNPDSSRSTSERPRLPRSADGEARTDSRPRSQTTADGMRSTSERPRLPRGADGEARADSRPRGQNGSDGMRSTSERPRLPRGADGEARADNRPRTPPRGSDGMRPTSERPQLPRGADVLGSDARPTRSRPAVDPRSPPPAPPKTGERAALPPQKPAVKQPAVPTGTLGPELASATPEGTGEAKPLEDLIPMFSEAIDQESLAHHFKEELGFLGTQLRSAQLPRSTRAQRLWAFFQAYAEASARTPDTHSLKGKEVFQAALQEHGFTELQDVNTGKDGVTVAMELLEAKSPEELQQKLANLRMEAKPEPVRTEVPAQPEAPAQPPQAEVSTPEAPAPELPAHASATPQRAEHSAETTGPVFDQAEPEKALAAQLPPVHAQGPQMPQLAGALPRTLRPDEPSLEELYGVGRDRRGTDKKLGSHMLWNVLHKLRDSPEDDAVKREQWSQLAFGAIVFLVGTFLVVAILVSL